MSDRCTITMIELGRIAGETSVNSAARDMSAPGQTRKLTGLFPRRYQFAL
jgi:hypothetical protein